MSESRKEPRIEEHADVSIRVRTAPEATNLEGKVFPSHSEDISMSGMKLCVDMPVPVGAVLDLEVMLKNSPLTYEMIANVIWADSNDDEESESNGEVGVILNINSNSQKASWNAAVAELH